MYVCVYICWNVRTGTVVLGTVVLPHREWGGRLNDSFQSLMQQRDKLSDELEEMTAQQAEQKKAFDQLVAESEQSLSEIEQTYDNKLALQSFVQYWTDQRSHHQTVMRWMGGATLVFSLVTGGVFVWVAMALLTETVTEMPAWKLGVMFALSTFGVWLTRLMAKIFISNLHLRADADERITMIQTYLALLREGSGPKDDERQLILQTLFRPSSSGFIKEDGVTNFQETVIKGLKR